MHRSRTTGVLGTLLAATLVLAACGGGTTATESAAPETAAGDPSPTTAEASASPSAAGEGEGDGEVVDTVSLAGGQFAPRSISIPAGTTVTFTDTGGHTVTEGSNGTAVDDPIVDETGGDDIEVAFDEPGTYSITCRIHPNMNMTVTVQG
jgi:plastocyanin